MKKKKIPTGIVNYRELKENNYYVADKSMMISDFMDRGSKVTLITRPRRFGKTLNMNMMSEFFDITKDSKEYFKDTKIMNTEYVKEMNQYPTIFISFANAKGDKMRVVKTIKQELLREYKKFKFVLEEIDQFDKSSYRLILESMNNLTDESLDNIDNALKFLMSYIEVYYHKKVMLFIDEYDTPFIEAHVNKFYDNVKSGLSSLLHNSLKDNDSLQYAMLTGIQRVAKENIFSDLNNLKVYTVRSKEYAQYFGFTKEETKQLLEYYDLEYNNQVKEMYDGYRIGGVEIYNPWSIINYADEKELRPYWVNTSSNKMVKLAMEKSDSSFKDGFENLIEQKYLETNVNMETSFYEDSSTESLWGLFINAGYLTIEQVKRITQYRICIPNNEVLEEFKSLTAHYLKVSETTLINLFTALENMNQDDFLSIYESIFLRIVSYHDLDELSEEKSYHLIMLGMCIFLEGDYTITSNRESGKGRSDIMLKSKKDYLPSFVIEFKYMKKEAYKKHPEQLKALAHEAIDQIVKEKYDIELIGNIIHIGLAHSGKNVEMVWVKNKENSKYHVKKH